MGEHDHHKVESVTKAFMIAFRMVINFDPRVKELPSTKGEMQWPNWLSSIYGAGNLFSSLESSMRNNGAKRVSLIETWCPRWVLMV